MVGVLTRDIEFLTSRHVSSDERVSTELAGETWLLDPENRSLSRPARPNVVGVDGKVFSSPLSTDLTERTNKKTGEIHPVRQDPARHPDLVRIFGSWCGCRHLTESFV